MKSFVFGLLLTGVLGIEVQQAIEFDNDDPKTVVTLTASNFDRKLKAGAPMLVEFYAPWCGHCKKFAPDYAKAANELKKKGITLYKIDGAKHREVTKRFNIEGFPAMRWIKDAKGEIVSEYPSTASMLKAESVFHWVVKKMSPACQELKTLYDDEVFTDSDSAYTIGFYDDITGTQAAMLDDIADEMEKFSFAKTSSKEIMDLYDVKPPAILHFTKYNKQRKFVLPEKDLMNSTEIRLWIFENSFPAPFEFDKTHTSDTIKALRRHSRFVNMLVVDPNADNTAVRKSFDEAAEKMAPEVLFTIMGSDLPESTNPMETLNIEPDDLPTIVLRASRQAKWTLPSTDILNIVPEELSDRLVNFVNDSLLRKIQIDTPPENEGFVHMSAENFTEVLEANHPMTVLFHNEKSWKSEKFRVRYLRAAKKVKEQGLDIRLGFVDIKKDWGEKAEITKLVTPQVDDNTVQFYTFRGPHAEVHEDYKIKTEHKNATVWLMDHLKAMAGERCPEIDDPAIIEEMKKKDDIVVIGFLETGDEAVRTHLEMGASKAKGGLFAWTKDKDVMKKYDVTPPTMIVFKTFDDPRLDFPTNENMTDINNLTHMADFIRKASTPTILDYSDDTAKHLIDNGPFCQLLLFVKEGTQQDPTPERKALEFLAKHYKEHILHVTIPSNLQGPMNFFKLKQKDIPAIVWVDKVNNQKAVFTEALAKKEAKLAKQDFEEDPTLTDLLAFFVKSRAQKYFERWNKEVKESFDGAKPKVTRAPAHEEL